MKFALITGLFAVLAQADSLMPRADSPLSPEVKKFATDVAKVGGCAYQEMFHRFEMLECRGGDREGRPPNILSCLCKNKDQASPIIKTAFTTCSSKSSAYGETFEAYGCK